MMLMYKLNWSSGSERKNKICTVYQVSHLGLNPFEQYCISFNQEIDWIDLLVLGVQMRILKFTMTKKNTNERFGSENSFEPVVQVSWKWKKKMYRKLNIFRTLLFALKENIFLHACTWKRSVLERINFSSFSSFFRNGQYNSQWNEANICCPQDIKSCEI